MQSLPMAFDALASVNQFVIYKLKPRAGDTGKMDKIPVHPASFTPHNAHDPAIWLSAAEAIRILASLDPRQYGLGFTFTESDPFWFLDIDSCFDGQWSTLAISLINLFPGALVEVSQSGRGLHIIGSGTVPSHACKNDALKLEFYTAFRFVALTGTGATGSAAVDFTSTLATFIPQYFQQSTKTKTGTWQEQWDEAIKAGIRADWSGLTDDKELIERMVSSTPSAGAAFGNKAGVRDLWFCNVEVLAEAYPPNDTDAYNASSADAALASHLLYWTGDDVLRVERLMLQSGLNREKYERSDYLPRTILSVLGRAEKQIITSPAQIIDPSQSQDNKPRATFRNSMSFLGFDQQIALFSGCVYVSDEHKVFIPGGQMLNSDRFNVAFGGFLFSLDNANSTMAKKAFDAFTQSQVVDFPKAESSTFKPVEAPGDIFVQEGQRLVNIYWPVITARISGDPTPFLNHLALVLPDERDRSILMAYLAACVQYPGVKFQWCPLLQGVQGNGKTLFTRCLAYAIGNRYSHFPNAKEIADKFNDWIFGKLFIGIEDIYTQDGKQEIIETLKPMLTNERLEIQAKYGNKATRDICANFLINTNHKDGLRKKTDDRRFAPFYTAQQTVDDLKNDHMMGDYFPNMYRWLNKENGYQIVNELLHTWIIPNEFNPATECIRAPHTSSTDSAIVASRGSVEQAIEVAIAEGQLGFRGGWVSSMALDKLLKELRYNKIIPYNKRKDLMLTLGYIHHPALKNGQANNRIDIDGGKPILYIEEGHRHREIVGGQVVADAYAEAQRVVD